MYEAAELTVKRQTLSDWTFTLNEFNNLRNVLLFYHI